MTAGFINWKEQIVVHENIFLVASSLCAKVAFCMLISVDTLFNQLPGEHGMKKQLVLRGVVTQQAVVRRNDFIIDPFPI